MAEHHAKLFVQDHFGKGWNLLEWANPNRHGIIALVENGGTYIVVQENSEGYDPMESDTHNAALAKEWFDASVRQASEAPNWELQAEYDEIWGPPLEPDEITRYGGW